MSRHLAAVLFGAAMLLPCDATSDPGDLDPTFGTDGIVRTGPTGTLGVALALQPDGRLVVVGRADTNTPDFGVVRYRRNGMLDPSFGNGETVTTDFSGGFDVATAVLVEPPPHQRVVVAGVGGVAGGLGYFALARYNPDGTLDGTFGSGGQVTTDFAGSGGEACSLVRQPDGKLVAAGSRFPADPFDPSDTTDFALVRYNPNGTLDGSFGTGGKVRTDFAGGSDAAAALVRLPDGRLVAAGRTVSCAVGEECEEAFALARNKDDGTLDETFGSGGLVTTTFGIEGENARALVLQRDGKLVAAGVVGNEYFGTLIALARYNDDGTLDAAFGGGGRVLTGFPGHPYVNASALVLQPDAKLVAAGGNGFGFVLVRYNPDGKRDPTFGSGGLVFTDVGVRDSIGAIVLQRDGRLVALGSRTLARYLGSWCRGWR